MTKRLEGIRDSLAQKHFREKEDADNLASMSGCTGRIEPRFSGFCYGFDAAIREVWPEVEKLVEALEKIIADYTGAEVHEPILKIARQALAAFREKLGDG